MHMGLTSIREQFLRLKTLKDVANLLQVKPSNLSYILYHYKPDNLDRSEQYTEFEIPKRNGGVRIISAPHSSLKYYQTQLSHILKAVYWKKPSAHGFVSERSIITNAHCHKNKRYVVNIDLENFFPSIHFGRVLGLFQSKPYSLPFDAAKVLAQISCTSHLPQGSPSSPIISNMICAQLDHQLQNYAKSIGLFYTRYADDITLSSNHVYLSDKLGIIKNNNNIELCSDFTDIIEHNGFKINQSKTRVQTKYCRQEVTGLTVNKFANISRGYIKDIRAILHSWEINGTDEASEKYIKRYYPKRVIKDKHLFFILSLRGRIAHTINVRKTSYLLANKHNKDKVLLQTDVSYKLLEKFINIRLAKGENVLIRTEGKTDWKHLIAAWEQLSSDYPEVNLDFHKYKCANGESKLMSFCESAKSKKTLSFNRPIICIFDRDNASYLGKHNAKCKGVKDGIRNWGNNVYSFVLPEVENFTTPSIEHYYDKNQIVTKNKVGRRLFFMDEFDEKTKIHLIDPTIKYIGKKVHNSLNLKRIIDSDVSKNGNSIALSKDAFAMNILQKNTGFSKVDFNNFKLIFEKINTISKS